MAMFDPAKVTKVLDDILSRRGLRVTLEPKEPPETVAPKGTSALPSEAKKVV